MSADLFLLFGYNKALFHPSLLLMRYEITDLFARFFAHISETIANQTYKHTYVTNSFLCTFPFSLRFRFAAGRAGLSCV